MAYRYGIPGVWDSTGEWFGRAAIDRHPKPFTTPLTCGRCGVAVQAVPSHSRAGQGGTTTAVAAHYRLNRGVEHKLGCEYDFERRANGIRVDSHGTVERGRGCWRLLLPAEGEAAAARTPPGKAEESAPRQELEIVASTTRLRPALTSARAIARLIADFDDDPELAEQFRADYRRRLIPWPDFYYADTRDDRVRLGSVLQDKKLTHPIAVAGRVHALRTGKSGAQRVEARGGIKRDDGGWTQIVLRAKDSALLPTEVGQQWLAYGDWQRWRADNGYTEVRLWLHGPWQILTL